MQHELRAHAILAIQKPGDLYICARRNAGELGCSVCQRDAAHFAFDLSPVSAFDLQTLDQGVVDAMVDQQVAIG